MSDPGSFDSLPEDDRLGRLLEEALRRIDAGEPVDPLGLASRFHVDEGEARDVLAGMHAIHSVWGEDVEAFAGPSFPSMRESVPPELPADYTLGEEIGRGGMGIVYAAHQHSLDRDVAVKVLRPGELLFGKSLARFEQEARTLGKLRHAHIVAIHEVGRSRNDLWFTMDLIRGRSLAEEIRAGRMRTTSRIVRMMRQVASAVSYVHEHGLIHRDLKPQNILIDERGDAFVTDFGLARDVRTEGSLTGTGQILGTPAYMSPEQARGDGEAISEATDVYSLGTILYECLTGRAPFRGASPVDLLHDVIHTPPTAPRRLAKNCPHDLEVICLKAMEKRPELRYPTVRALLQDLERFEEGREIHARRRSTAYRFVDALSRHRVSAFGLVGVVALTVFATIAVLVPRLRLERDLQLAERWRSEGRHELAVVILGDTLTELRGASLRAAADDLGASLIAIASPWRRAGRSASLLEQIERCLSAGREARGLPANGVRVWPAEGTPWPLEADLLIERALALHVLGRDVEAREGMLEAIAAHAITGRGFSEATLHPGVRAALTRVIEEPEDPAYAMAARWLIQGSPVPVLERWLTLDEATSWLRLRAGLVALSLGEESPSFAMPALLVPLADLLALVSPPDLESRLRSLIADERTAEPLRTLAARALGLHLDLPALGDVPPRGATPRDVENLLEQARVVAGSSPALAYEPLVELALEQERLPEAWLVRRTGAVPPRGSENERRAFWEAWWAEHRREDPRERLAKTFGLDRLPDVDLSLRLLDHVGRSEQARLFTFLRLLQPAGEAPIPFAAESSHELVLRAWKNALKRRRGDEPLAVSYSIRLSWFELSREGWSERAVRQERALLAVGEERTFEFARPRVEEGLHLSTRFPGFPLDRPREEAVQVIRCRVRSSADEEGARLDVEEIVSELEGPARSVAAGAGPHGLPVGRVLLLTPSPIGLAGEFGEVAALAIVEEESEPRTWDLSTWNDRLQKDLARFVAKARSLESTEARSSLLEKETRWLANVTTLGAMRPWEGVLEDWRSLQELSKVTRDDGKLAARCLAARLMAGDPELLGGGIQEELAFLEKANLDPGLYSISSRLLLQHAGSELGRLVGAELEEREAVDFLARTWRKRLVGWGLLEAGPGEESSVPRVAFPSFVNAWKAYVLAAMLLVTLSLGTFHGVLRGQGATAAAWWLGSGLVTSALSVVHHGVEFLPTFAGLALAAIAGASLSRRVRGRRRWWVPRFFALAALCHLATFLGASGDLAWFGALAATAGILFLPDLAWGLEHGDMTPLRDLLATCQPRLGVLLMMGALFVPWAIPELAEPQFLPGIVFLFVCAWWVLVLVRRTRRDRLPWPFGFVLAGVVPMTSLQLYRGLLLWHPRAPEASDTPFALAIWLAILACGWALLRLVDGTSPRRRSLCVRPDASLDPG